MNDNNSRIEVVATGFAIFWYDPESKQLKTLALKDRKKGHWSSPKGVVDPNEQWLQAAVRETFEETGLVPVWHYKYWVDCTGECRYKAWGKSKLSVLYPGLVEENYAALLESGPAITLSDEHSDYKWMSMAEYIKVNKHQTDKCEAMEKLHLYIQDKIKVGLK